ncbi:MAG: AAA family ATPase [Hydrotalea sp.]|nr:AAA family ATPase [Hydrotalea sp.]
MRAIGARNCRSRGKELFFMQKRLFFYLTPPKESPIIAKIVKNKGACYYWGITPMMRLKSFQIKDYKSIQDTGIVEVPEDYNLVALLGQNESGKSAVLEALRDFQKQEISEEALRDTNIASIACSYKITNKENFRTRLQNSLKNFLSRRGENFEKIDLTLTLDKLDVIKLIFSSEDDELTIDDNSYNIISASIPDKESPSDEITPSATQKIFNIAQEKLAELIWSRCTPAIKFFNGRAPMLPDSITIADLTKKDNNEEGYQAVKNFERILGINLAEISGSSNQKKRDEEVRCSKIISDMFNNSWRQRLHFENSGEGALIKFSFQEGGGNQPGPRIDFFINTQSDKHLKPSQKSLGFSLFFSFWLEMQGQGSIIFLLDEPDQHLHIKAQEDLLKFLEEISDNKDDQQVQIIYSTHSPFLINVDKKLYRNRIVINKKEEGTQVNLVSKPVENNNGYDAITPITRAMGISNNFNFSFNEKVVILEEISGFYYMEGMRKLLGIDKSYKFIPATGAGNIPSIVSYAIGYGLEWLVVMDKDNDSDERSVISKRIYGELLKFFNNEDDAQEKIKILKFSEIEHMFEETDFKLFRGERSIKFEKGKACISKDKPMLAASFSAKIDNDNIKKEDISEIAQKNFKEIFDFIDKGFTK